MLPGHLAVRSAVPPPLGWGLEGILCPGVATLLTDWGARRPAAGFNYHGPKGKGLTYFRSRRVLIDCLITAHKNSSASVLLPRQGYQWTL